ncbi:uncharacterized protein UTRI_00205 [Ustilago trichophora]|uniref:Uncharacterized protein n=1 Tax=Ustilago trichophora TaxID=86804 RepID=A0A5C3DUP5_9BASI|nr:uncharacterized protein UTRI_00205 [Ustilago trichophora]
MLECAGKRRMIKGSRRRGFASMREKPKLGKRAHGCSNQSSALRRLDTSLQSQIRLQYWHLFVLYTLITANLSVLSRSSSPHDFMPLKAAAKSIPLRKDATIPSRV